MIINTSTFSIGLIIFLVYNINMITLIASCDTSTSNTNDALDTNKLFIDYDMIKVSDNNNYYRYAARISDYAGQRKILPKTFFRSVYNCNYLILPELNDPIDYDAYEKTIIQKQNAKMQSIIRNYNEEYNRMKIKDDNYVAQFEQLYKVTAEAYAAEKNNEEPKIIYQNTQRPDIEYDSLKVLYKNYELYHEPTKKDYYRSNLMQSRLDAIKEIDGAKNCKILSKKEYYKVQFYYNFLQGIKFNFLERRNDILRLMINKDKINYSPEDLNELESSDIEEDHNELKSSDIKKNLNEFEIYDIEEDHNELKSSDIKKNHNELKSSDIKKKYQKAFHRLTKNFVVNSENYMSYLVRMKIMGYIGLHQDYLKHLYHTRPDFYKSEEDHQIIMDIHAKLPGNFTKLQLDPIVI